MDRIVLTNESISSLIEEIRTFLVENKVGTRNVTRTCLAVEEVLLEYHDKLGDGVPLTLTCKKRLGYTNVILRIEGESLDPFAHVAEEDIPLRFLLTDVSYHPTWSYQRGSNVVRFDTAVEKKDRTLALIIGAVALGVALGLLARYLPGDMGKVISDSYLQPVTSTILGLLNTLATLLIFVSVVAGICGIGDIATFNRIGKRIIFRFLLLMLGGLMLCVLICLMIFPLHEHGTSSVDTAALWQMILAIIPTNIVDAFLKGNALQVVFLAICTGVVMLTLESRVEKMAEWNRMVNLIVQKLLQLVIKAMPLVVFISIFRLAVSNDLTDMKGVYKYPLLMAACCFLTMGFFILRTAITHRVSAAVLIRKLLPTYVIAITTSSSAAAYSTMIETCEEKLGIDRQIVNIGVPLGQALYKTAMIFSMLFGTFCLAELYNVPITLAKLIPMLLTVYILAVGAPPVPGTGISCFTLLFYQMGLPMEAVSIIIALDVLNDRISVSTKLTHVQMELVQLSASLGKLDEKKLRS